jgi:adenine-specific DNA-methyltransferase
MFGVEKFNVVIGNPPYVGEKGHKEIFQPIAKSSLGKRFYLGKMDLFYFFFHLGLDLLQEGGVLSFISTNYYITATGAKKLRDDFKIRSTVINLINFNELKIFESALGQHNLITILQKGNYTKNAFTASTKRKGYANSEILNNITSGLDTETSYHSLSQDELFSGENIKLTSGGLDDILNKIKKNSISLGEIANVNVGLYTGADKVSKNYINKYHLEAKIGEGIFLLNDKELKDKNFNDYEIDLCVPFFKNSDISRYTTKQKNDKWLIDFSYPNFTDYPVEKYPNIFKHLSRYKAVLENRQSNDNGLRSVVKQGFWWLFTKRKLDFTQEKIVAPQRSKTNTFGYNNIPWYASADVYFITQPKDGYSLKFLLGLMNSHLIFQWLYNRGKRKGEMLELYQEPLSVIPIPLIITKNKKKIEDVEILVNKIFDAKQDNKDIDTKELENQIDELVMDLYELNDEEKKIIRNSIK